MKYPEFIYEDGFPREECEGRYTIARVALVRAAVPAAVEAIARVEAAAIRAGGTFEADVAGTADQVVGLVDHLLQRLYEG
ncbi:MAG: hypothetical protein WDA41_08955 [Candidatus Neomarinimicrobiota bacterium]|jgi:hypothetical protein